MITIVNVDSTNVSFGDDKYPKMFYAKATHNGIVEIRNKNTEKLFVRKIYSEIKVDTVIYTNATLTVNALNAILTPTLA